MEIPKIGFIGFGEVGKAFSKVMRENGANVYYYDIVEKKQEKDIKFLTFKELITKCDIIISTIVTNRSIEVAKKSVRYLNNKKTYADLNSTSAFVKNKIGDIIIQSGSNFIEGAILNAIDEKGANAHILVSGVAAENFTDLMNKLGLVNMKYYSKKIGDSSRVKMVRSIFSKGVECLLLELLIAAKRVGIEQYIWNDIIDFIGKGSFEHAAKGWIGSHPLACERRYHEVLQVIETLEDMGIDPIMTKATSEFFNRSRIMKLDKFLNEKPKSFWEVPNYIEENYNTLKI